MSDATTAKRPDTALRSILVAGGVAFICALVVSTIAVNLRPFQNANREAERQERVATIITNIPGLEHLAGAGAATSFVLELGTANMVDGVSPDQVDVDEQLKDPERSITIPTPQDTAGLKRLENRKLVYAIRNDSGRIQTVILPVRGLGYASMLKGYLAIKGDGTTIQGIEFYQHGETPGLGARIETPAFKRQWVGKQAYNDAGGVAIEVVKGTAQGPYEVDALSGATRTSEGVNNLVRFWLGPMAYGPFLKWLGEQAPEETANGEGS